MQLGKKQEMHTAVSNREQAIILLKVDLLWTDLPVLISWSLAVKEANRKLCLVRRGMEKMDV